MTQEKTTSDVYLESIISELSTRLNETTNELVECRASKNVAEYEVDKVKAQMKDLHKQLQMKFQNNTKEVDKVKYSYEVKIKDLNEQIKKLKETSSHENEMLTKMLNKDSQIYVKLKELEEENRQLKAEVVELKGKNANCPSGHSK